ncbi:MAG: GAF domain-containing protein [Tunicatimonas sp.]|uniref:GAF domain-containing protein n=1 Tax=Tunicatimonas sp. TaxID=1940096 RepID=UPI003C72FA65
MFKIITRENINSLLLGVVALLILLNGISTFRNNHIIIQNNQLRERITLAKQVTASVLTRIIQATDVAVRGYAITEEEVYINAFEYLYKKQINIYAEIIDHLQALNIEVSSIRKLESSTLSYIDFSMEMIEQVKVGNTDKFKQMLEEGRGDELYEVYVAASNEVFTQMDQLNEEATNSYDTALKWNKWLQVILLITSLPTIVSVILRIKKESKGRNKLYEKLAENNHTYLFNPGQTADDKQHNTLENVLDNSIQNMQQASDFVTQIADGDYNVQWNGLNEKNEALNNTTLAGALLRMRQKMNDIKEADQKNLWMTRGLTEFSKLVRDHGQDFKSFVNQSTTYLVKYLNSQQGGLFVVSHNNTTYLQLEACYAFNKEKFVEKRVEVGQGLVGQAYLEKKPAVLTKVPQGYTQITSGLGDATPNCLIVMPFQYNEKVEAVFEIASFDVLEPHQQEFLTRAGEFMASALVSLKMSKQQPEIASEAQ